MRAKFYVNSVTDFEGGTKQAQLRAVYDDGHPENNQFAKATPGGELSISIDNPAAQDFFVPGQAYYLDFTKAPA